LELTEAMRSQGCANIKEVRVAILENNRKIQLSSAIGTRVSRAPQKLSLDSSVRFIVMRRISCFPIWLSPS
jgi:uncharacterized membrane protein YcaP (DUF421 family)